MPPTAPVRAKINSHKKARLRGCWDWAGPLLGPEPPDPGPPELGPAGPPRLEPLLGPLGAAVPVVADA
ncbi:hypothetical protein HH1059_24430 [Halorhodospira halochloris]|uniref:Uncharacterized protein n=1 Tax=Halorhodospira halochloris TaxID=1052 RepID=A0A2Z6EZW9_HALHR|nr:hypothetical protein HH1059_24430 [Halorhodospira halochloris]